MRVFLDSVLVIYLVEQNPAFSPQVEAWLMSHPCDIVSSDLVRMESLIHPVRNNDLVRVADFEDFFRLQVAETVPLTPLVFDQAIHIRAHLRFSTPDSLHLAAAVVSACDVFLTNDAQLAGYTGITVELI